MYPADSMATLRWLVTNPLFTKRGQITLGRLSVRKRSSMPGMIEEFLITHLTPIVVNKNKSKTTT